jgi:hypothetical protein
LYEGKFIMAFTTFTGPVRSLNGFAQPIIYITSALAAQYSNVIPITAGSQVLILSPADGGPASEVTLTLPLVQTTNGQAFSITNADPNYAGLRGFILNYGAVAHVLAGYQTSPGVFQRVNLDADGVVLPAGYAVEYGGNGNPDAPWAASQMVLCTGNT